MTRLLLLRLITLIRSKRLKPPLILRAGNLKVLRTWAWCPIPRNLAITFLENARIKARAAHELVGTAVLADDSGLIVDALDGAPGVYSSRYSGVDGDDSANNAKLLQELDAVPLDKRTARFASVLVFIDEDGTRKRSQRAL